jgi:hypothetical protein
LSVGKQNGFEIKNTKGTEDLGWMDCPNDVSAVAFGKGVVQDLTRGEAKQYTDWTIEIMQGKRAVDSVPVTAKVGDWRRWRQ